MTGARPSVMRPEVVPGILSGIVPVVTALLLGVVALGGCAASGPAPRPEDYPLHAVSQPFDLHWRVTVDQGTARADGLAVRQNTDVGAALLQLVGVDAGGQIVAFSVPHGVRWDGPWDSESFTMSLAPKGGEQRYDVRVLSFRLNSGMSNGR